MFPAANGVRPDFSPVVTISAQAVQNLFEEWGAKYSTFKPVVNVVQGGLTEALGSENMQESILQQVIPNTTAYRFIEAAEGNDTSFNSAMMLTMQSLAYSQNVAMEKWRNEGSKGPEPDIIPPPDASPEQLQAFLSKVKNQTRIVFLQRAILGAVSPVSADVTVNDFGLNAKLQADINSSKSVDAGFQKFLLANPNATPYTTAESTTATGKSLPDTQGALDWIESNSSLLNKYQYGGMWLMPNLKDNTYSSSAYYNEIADGLRQRLAPSAYLNALYTANGDQTYYTALARARGDHRRCRQRFGRREPGVRSVGRLHAAPPGHPAHLVGFVQQRYAPERCAAEHQPTHRDLRQGAGAEDAAERGCGQPAHRLPVCRISVCPGGYAI